MKKTILLPILLVLTFQAYRTIAQQPSERPIRRLDNSGISAQTLTDHIDHLMARAQVTGIRPWHSEGWQHYSIAFPDKGIAMIIMTNSDQGESIFKELLATAIGDTYTPFDWNNYIPYDKK